MYVLMARSPGLIIVFLGFVCLFSGGVVTLMGLGMIVIGGLILCKQISDPQQRPMGQPSHERDPDLTPEQELENEQKVRAIWTQMSGGDAAFVEKMMHHHRNAVVKRKSRWF